MNPILKDKSTRNMRLPLDDSVQEEGVVGATLVVLTVVVDDDEIGREIATRQRGA